MPQARVWMPPIYVNPLRLTPAAISLLWHSHSVADACGHNSVAGEHVLSSLISCEGQGKWSAGLLLDRLADRVKLESYVSSVVPVEPATISAPGNPPLAEPLVAALLLAADHSEADSRYSVTTADLLIGILGVKGAISSTILTECGLRESSAVADAATSINDNSLALTATLMRGPSEAADLPSLLADLDDRNLRLLGGRLLRSYNSSGNDYAARRWIIAHTINSVDPTMRIGPLSARHPRSAHASMRVAYAIGDKLAYLDSLVELADSTMKWGRFEQATAVAAAARQLAIQGFDDTNLTALEGELSRHSHSSGTPHGVPEPFAEALGRVSAEQGWMLLLRYPQLLSPAGLAYAAANLEEPISYLLRHIAHLGSWDVARELLRREQVKDSANLAAVLNEGVTELAIRKAMNYVEGLPSDDSRAPVEDEGYSEYEFEPSDDLAKEFRLIASVALGHLIAADIPRDTAAYAVQFGQHAQQQVEIIKVELEHLDFAIECFALAVENTDTADSLYVSRVIALSQALELRFTLNRDIRSVESAATRLWEALYCCTPPDSALGRLYYRLSELSAIPHSTLVGLREIPAELSLASGDWLKIVPSYDADLLVYPAGIVLRHTPDSRVDRFSQLLGELTDDDGRPKMLWAPDSRPGRSWNQLAELALELALDPSRSVAERNALFKNCEAARKLAIERATTVSDEASARFGLVELGRAKLSQSDSFEEQLHSLLSEVERCREHDDQLGSARVRRLAEWSGEAHALLHETKQAISEYMKALAIEERIFGAQAGLRHRILARSAEPSNIATRLSLIQGDTDPGSAVSALERGRALVFRALTDGLEPQKAEWFLPTCDASVFPPETFGRPIARTSYRTIATLSRLGVRHSERTEPTLPPSATSAEIRRALEARGANLAYLVAGPSEGGVLTVQPSGRAEFVNLKGFSSTALRGGLPSATPDDDTSFRMDEWYERFQNQTGGAVWTLLGEILDPTIPLYLVACGITAAFPWSACRPYSNGAVRYLASGTHLVRSGDLGSTGLPLSCRILSAADSPGRPLLEFAEVEVQSILTKWATHDRSVGAIHSSTFEDCMTALASDVDVCHIVSHAAGSDSDPLRQGLALANGFVLTTDILGSQAPVNAGLVVLSSCHSGQAAFEVPNEFISLSSSLVAKGARGTIGNMWAIDDFTSCVIMEVLHELLHQAYQPADAVARIQEAGRSRDADFFKAHALLLGSVHVPDDFIIDELFAPGSWAGLHYVGQ